MRVDRQEKPALTSRTFPRFEKCYSLRDLIHSLEILARADKSDSSAPIEAILSLCRLNPTARAYTARSGRECIYLALQLLHLHAKSRIGVPLYCCPCVFEAIVAAGHVPVFIDIDLSSYSLAPEAVHAARLAIDALLVVHTFGYPADIEKIRDALGKRNIPIIEDCAHALFSEYRGKAIGTLTQMSVFSFGLRKPAAAGGGGLLVLNDPDLPRSGYVGGKVLVENRLRETYHAANCWLRSVAYDARLYGFLMRLPLSPSRDGKKPNGNGDNEESACHTLRWAVGRLRVTDRIRIASAIAQFERRTQATFEAVGHLRRELEDTPLVIPTEPQWGKWNHFWIPIRFPNAEQCESGHRLLWRRRIDMAPVWRESVSGARRFGYRGGCSQAEQAARTVCRLPSSSLLTAGDREYLSESLRQSVGL